MRRARAAARRAVEPFTTASYPAPSGAPSTASVTDRVLLGDFNGDGWTDQLCWYEAQPEGNRVRLSTGTGFAAPQTWLAGYTFQRPMAADVNGDGKADVVDFRYWDAVFNVATSTGTAFNTPTQWGVAHVSGYNPCRVDPAVTGTGDFNGDGLPDVFCRLVTSTTIFVGLSTGSSLDFSVFSHGNPCDTEERNGVMDFDGDGKDDWYCIGAHNRDLWVYRSNGASFYGPVANVGSGFCTNADDYSLGDLNGDGRTDAMCHPSGNVALSTGRRFVLAGSHPGSCTATGTVLTDVDGDGSSEVVCNVADSGTNQVRVSKWVAGTLLASEVWKENWCTGKLGAGDFNGDGKADLFCESTGAMAVSGTGGLQADLIGSIANGLGGTIQVAYSPSTTFPGTNNPPPKHVITSLTRLDGRGGSSTSTYVYAGGLIYRKERRFLGFRQMIENLPCIAGETDCPWVNTLLSQTLASAGRPATITRQVGSGRRLHRTDFGYTINEQTVPTTSLLTEETVTFYSESGFQCPSFPCANAKRRSAEHSYGQFGNRIQTIFRGDKDVAGDETTTVWSFRPNTSLYIVDRVSVEQRFEGAGTGGTKLTERKFFYDGAEGNPRPPTKGALTTSWGWLDTENRLIPRSFLYDQWGNVTSVIDETGRETTTTWDATQHVFPTSVTNGAGEITTTVWDPVCGVPVEANDANQVAQTKTTMQYDSLCRPTRADLPLGGFKAWAYVALGNPGAPVHAQRLIESSPSPSADWDGGGDHSVANYFDGFGRTYRVVAKGPSPESDIVQDTVYNARGQRSSQTAPYYESASPVWTSYDFGPLDRLARVRFADDNEVTKTYGLLSETTTDEHGHPVTARFDLYGRPTARIQMLGGDTVETESTYDLLGRLVGMTDDHGNQWSWTFDSLGRTTEKSDPDAGTWTYEYDDAGRLTAQVDAKQQRTEYAYDAAGRLESKTTRLPQGSLEQTTTFARGEDRPGFYNRGQVTSIWAMMPNTPTIDTRLINYDARGQVVNESRSFDGMNFVTQWRYDAGGRLKGTTYPDDGTVGAPGDPLRYDAAGRLLSASGIVTNVLYDAAGRPITQTNANGTHTDRAYSAERGFLTAMATTSGNAWIQNLTYTPDQAGMLQQVISMNDNGSAQPEYESWSYIYDGLHRLEVASSFTNHEQASQSFLYDTIGRMTYNSRIGYYTYPAPGLPRPHAPSSAGPNSYTYDANGNLVSGGGRTLQWNVDNLPTQVNDVQFVYGATGDRIKKASTAGTSHYPLGDDYEVTNGIKTAYISLPNVGLVAKRIESVPYWLHTDRLGSIQAITDGSGAVAQRMTYRPYGDKIADETSHIESRGYIDQRQDDETGLTYLHVRYYDSTVGVFISPDPFAPNAGLNSYAYGAGDPINMSDRSGLCPGCEQPDALPFDRISLFNGPINYTYWRYLAGLIPPSPSQTIPGPGSGEPIPVVTCPGDPACPTPNPPPTEPHIKPCQRDSSCVGDLLADFAAGTGPESSYHGPDDPMTQQLMNAPGVNAARDYFYDNGLTNLTGFAGAFGPLSGELLSLEPVEVLGRTIVGYDGLLSSDLNVTRQFVGSYRVDIVPAGNGRLMFMVTNSTSLPSLAYHLPGIRPVSRSAFLGAPVPYGTTHQMYYWTDPRGTNGGGGW